MDRKPRIIGVFVLTLALLLSSCRLGAQSPTSGADGIGDPYFPLLGNGGYDVQTYNLDLAWDNSTSMLSGGATIEAIATSNLNRFNLDFVGFTIQAITVNEAPAEFSRLGPELTITPSANLPAGELFTVSITYSGEPEPMNNRVGGVRSGWMAVDSTVVVPPFSSAGWFPANDHARDKALYVLKLTVPHPLDVVASGKLVETINNGDTSTFIWRTEEVAFMPTVAVDNFESRALTGPGDLPIYVFFGVDNPEAADAANQTGVIGDILAFFTERFGAFPFESCNVVLPNTMNEIAFSLHTVFVIRPDVFAASVLAHELSHQWFGNSVSPFSLEDMWLVEGFATYAEALWVEHTTGEDMLVSYYDVISQMGPPGTPPPDNIYDHSVYGRGAWTLKMLHTRLGDDVFFEIVRAYTDRYRQSVASTDDFIALVEEISGEALGDFFDEWLYAEVMPTVPELSLGE